MAVHPLLDFQQPGRNGNVETRRVKIVRFNTGGFVILGRMNIHGGEAERVYSCLWEIALWRWSFCFVTLSLQTVKSFKRM